MANIKSAKKRAGQAVKNRQINLARKTALKTAVKKILAAIENKNGQDSLRLLQDAEAKFSRAKSKGVIHARNASRKISRLAKRVAVLNRVEKPAAKVA